MLVVDHIHVLSMTVCVVCVAKAKPKRRAHRDLKEAVSSDKMLKLRSFGEELPHEIENTKMFDGCAY
jgi:hypothetical protein